MKMTSPITTHVLDTARGRPAEGVPIALEVRSAPDAWTELARGVTDADGRLRDLLPGGRLEPGVYRLTFDTGAYFRARRVEAFYPHVTVVFEVRDGEEHHHVPLLLSPYGYSTYRGS
jgi:5-hydroxyisourate hydrolase